MLNLTKQVLAARQRTRDAHSTEPILLGSVEGAVEEYAVGTFLASLLELKTTMQARSFWRTSLSRGPMACHC